MQARLSRPVRAIKLLPAGRSQALRAWNRVERLRGERRVPTYFGANIACNPVDIIQATITHFGVWEPNISRLFERVIEPGDVVADLGANIGYYSLLFSKLVGSSGQVVSIEALPRLAETVRDNARRNGMTNIRVENCAASDHRGRL